MLTSQNHNDFLLFFVQSTKNKSHKKINKNMKNTPLQNTPLKPKKYQHFHLPGRSRGPPQTTKITPGPPWTPPRPPQKTGWVFGASRALPEEPPGPPGDPPRHPHGPHRDAQRPPRAPRRPPRDPRGNPTEPEDPPSDLQGPPNDAQGPPGDPQHPPGTAPSIRPGGMRGAIE